MQRCQSQAQAQSPFPALHLPQFTHLQAAQGASQPCSALGLLMDTLLVPTLHCRQSHPAEPSRHMAHSPVLSHLSLPLCSWLSTNPCTKAVGTTAESKGKINSCRDKGAQLWQFGSRFCQSAPHCFQARTGAQWEEKQRFGAGRHSGPDRCQLHDTAVPQGLRFPRSKGHHSMRKGTKMGIDSPKAAWSRRSAEVSMETK